MGYRVVVAGATGNVGREMLNILDERAVPRRRDCRRLPAENRWAQKSALAKKP